jgi:N-methylhydantoinase B
MLLDSLAGGGGARSFADGVDTAGVINSPKAAIANIEVNEHNYPMLYLWRRQAPDSGGPGRYRGGLGGEHAYILHRADRMESTQFAHGVEQPTGLGVAGGEPGSLQGFLRARCARDLTARRVSDLAGELEVLPAKGTIELRGDDVFVHLYAGGGGLGDPLERAPDEVARDVHGALVSREAAADEYFVVVDATGVVDEEATDALRAAERRRRLAVQPATAARRGESSTGRRSGRRLSRHITVSQGVCACRHCGRQWGPIGAPMKAGLAVEQVAIPDRWPAAGALSGSARFVIRRFWCPGCATQIETEVNLATAPFVTSFEG